MYCPACGADAGAAKFCPECGTDLKRLIGPPVCSACGSEVPEGAKFCPECGEPARGTAAGRARHAAPGRGTEVDEGVAAASGGGRRTGTRGKTAGAGQQRRQQPRPEQAAKGKGGRAATSRPAGRVSPLVAWGVIVAVVAVAVVVVAFYAAGRGDSGTAASPGAVSQQPVAADTSGSYTELVQRGNDLYDQGAVKFQAKQYAQGAEYYLAASKVYAAAWKQQPGDPAVGTDLATALFYSGKIDAALEQIDKVLAESPEFQTAWFNKGNYLAEKGSQADKAGNAKAANAAYAGARAAYQKAVDLDSSSSSGQQARQQLSALPTPSP
jgi:hypothetical protein